MKFVYKTVIFVVSTLLTFINTFSCTTTNIIDSKFYNASNNSIFESFSDSSPSSNHVNAIIFMVEFHDVKFNPEYSEIYSGDHLLTPQELQTAVFGKEDITSINYPYESVSAYYNRSSYGKLKLSGTVKPYTAKHDRSYYDSTSNGSVRDSSIGYEKLMMEVLDYYDEEIDYTQYDSNNDMLLDNIYLSVPLNGDDSDDTWWGNQSTWVNNMDYCVDGEYISKYVILDGQPFKENITYYNQICIHETGHLMGLPDYYDTKANDDDFERFNGMAGYDMMDEMSGDHNAFSKIMLGWITSMDIVIADTSTYNSDYTLTAIEDTKNTLLIPINNWDGNFCSEYYLLEYDNETKNNANAALEYTSYLTDEDTVLDVKKREGGIRVWHVNAELTNDYWEKECNMFAYDSNTTDSEDHLLELVSNPSYEKDGFFRTGDEIVLPDGPIITINQFENGTYHLSIKFTKKN